MNPAQRDGSPLVERAYGPPCLSPPRPASCRAGRLHLPKRSGSAAGSVPPGLSGPAAPGGKMDGWKAAGSSGSTGVARSPTWWAGARTARSPCTSCCRRIPVPTTTRRWPASGTCSASRRETPFRPNGSPWSAWAPRWRRTPCLSARASRAPWSSPRASPTPCGSPTRTGRGSSTGRSSARTCCTPGSSRPPSASARTARCSSPSMTRPWPPASRPPTTTASAPSRWCACTATVIRSTRSGLARSPAERGSPRCRCPTRRAR